MSHIKYPPRTRSAGVNKGPKKGKGAASMPKGQRGNPPKKMKGKLPS